MKLAARIVSLAFSFITLALMVVCIYFFCLAPWINMAAGSSLLAQGTAPLYITLICIFAAYALLAQIVGWLTFFLLPRFNYKRQIIWLIILNSLFNLLAPGITLNGLCDEDLDEERY